MMYCQTSVELHSGMFGRWIGVPSEGMARRRSGILAGQPDWATRAARSGHSANERFCGFCDAAVCEEAQVRCPGSKLAARTLVQPRIQQHDSTEYGDDQAPGTGAVQYGVPATLRCSRARSVGWSGLGCGLQFCDHGRKVRPCLLGFGVVGAEAVLERTNGVFELRSGGG